MIRVALLTQDARGMGGVPTVVKWIVDELMEAPGFSCTVFEAATSAADPWSRRAAVPATWLRRTLVEEPPDGVVFVGANLTELEFMRYRPRRELDRILRSFDVVQVVAGGPALINVARRADVPIVAQLATFTGWERQALQASLRSGTMALNRPIIERMERRGVRLADRVFVENRVMEQAVLDLGQSAVAIAPPGVDTDRFLPAGEWAADRPLLSVCRLSDPRKGLERMVEAYAKLIDPPPLTLAGAGVPPPSLSQRIVDLGIGSRVRIMSDVPAEALPALYRSSSCFLQTSYEEGLGLASVEAMASGLPVVASLTAGSSAVVSDGKTGRLINEGPEFEDRFASAVTDAVGTAGAEWARASRARAVGKFSRRARFDVFRHAYEDLASR